MNALYNESAKKRSANLSINGDLLNLAKDLRINISATFEEYLKKVIKTEKEKKWHEENCEAIESYNLEISQNGSFGDKMRSF